MHWSQKGLSSNLTWPFTGCWWTSSEVTFIILNMDIKPLLEGVLWVLKTKPTQSLAHSCVLFWLPFITIYNIILGEIFSKTWFSLSKLSSPSLSSTTMCDTQTMPGWQWLQLRRWQSACTKAGRGPEDQGALLPQFPAWPAGVNHDDGKTINIAQPNTLPWDQKSHGKNQKIIIKLTASTTGSFSLFKRVL